jgi:hypothetical protein
MDGLNQSSIERRLLPRCLKYAVTVENGTCGRRSDRDLALQTGNYRQAARESLAVEQRARKVLSESGVVPAFFGAYLAFCREAARECRRATGAARLFMLAGSLVRWQAQGLRRDVLLRLISVVQSDERRV